MARPSCTNRRLKRSGFGAGDAGRAFGDRDRRSAVAGWELGRTLLGFTLMCAALDGFCGRPDRFSRFLLGVGVDRCWAGDRSHIDSLRLLGGAGGIRGVGDDDGTSFGQEAVAIGFPAASSRQNCRAISRDEERVLAKPLDCYAVPLMQNLDPSQRSFVEAPAGHTRLLAPAGCGKTHTLLARCAFLSEQTPVLGPMPTFLIVSFTTAASKELQRRLNAGGQFLPPKSRTEIRTLNSWGWRRFSRTRNAPHLVTRQRDQITAVETALSDLWAEHDAVKSALSSRRLTYPSLLELIDEFKSLAFIHKRHTDYQSFCSHVDDLEQQGLGAYLTHQLAQHLKDGGILDQEHLNDLYPNIFSRFYRFWLAAVPALAEAGYFTYDDQKYFALLDELNLLTELSTSGPPPTYDHILVDEFQDINPLDLGLIKAIRERTNATMTIVGDDDQAIYEWRAGTPEYILNPDTIFQIPFETKILQVNYRSPANMIRMSQRLISQNRRRVPKHTQAQPSPPEDATIEVINRTGDIDSLHELDLLREDGLRKGIDPTRTAILTRRNDQLINPQIYFMTERIHIAVARDQQLATSDSYRALLELLQIKAEAENPRGIVEAQGAVLSLLRGALGAGVGRQARARIRRILPRQGSVPVLDAVSLLADHLDSGSFASPGERQLRNATIAVEDFIESTNVVDALSSLEQGFELFKEDREESNDDIFRAAPPFGHLMSHSRRFGNDPGAFVDFLEDSAKTYVHDISSDESSTERQSSGPEFRAIRMMTAHRAKGREFDFVILPDVVDGIWPSGSHETIEEKEEERRVFYVAFTRARRRVSIMVNRDRGSAQSPYIAELGLSP